MPIYNEKGGILLELALFTLILLLFSAGALATHQGLGRRFEKILNHRNEGIRKARSLGLADGRVPS